MMIGWGGREEERERKEREREIRQECLLLIKIVLSHVLFATFLTIFMSIEYRW